MPKANPLAQNVESQIGSTPDSERPLVYLNPDDIKLDPITDVRVGPSVSNELEKVDLLARSLYEQGQLQPILVRPGKNGKYLLTAGRRRLAAAKLIREKTKMDFTLAAYVLHQTDEDAYRSALLENIQRENFTPLNLALNIRNVRERFGWAGGENTKEVAAFLRVSPATVTQHEKILTLPTKIQKQIHEGVLSAQSAFDLVAVSPKAAEIGIPVAQLQEEIVERASELAEEEEQLKAKDKRKPAKDGKADGKADGTASEEPTKIKRQHILTAAREKEAVENKARTRKEIVDLFTSLTGPAYPKPLTDFASLFIDNWLPGEIGDQTLINRWNGLAAIIEPVVVHRPPKKPVSKPVSEPAVKKPVKKTPVKKTTRKK